MPALILKSIDENKACAFSKILIDDLEKLLECPRDYFSIELSQSKFILDGEFVDGHPTVEVYWFDRGHAVQDTAAKLITQHVNSAGYSSVDVIFYHLDKEKYYENGEHY